MYRACATDTCQWHPRWQYYMILSDNYTTVMCTKVILFTCALVPCCQRTLFHVVKGLARPSISSKIERLRKASFWFWRGYSSNCYQIKFKWEFLGISLKCEKTFNLGWKFGYRYENTDEAWKSLCLAATVILTMDHVWMTVLRMSQCAVQILEDEFDDPSSIIV